MQIVFIMLVWILWLNCIIKVASWADSCKWVFSFSVISKQIYFVMHIGDIIIYQWDVQCPTLVPSNLKMLCLLCCCVPLSQGSQTQLIWGPLESGWGWGELNIVQKNTPKKQNGFHYSKKVQPIQSSQFLLQNMNGFLAYFLLPEIWQAASGSTSSHTTEPHLAQLC